MPQSTYTYSIPDLTNLKKEDVLQLAVEAVQESWDDQLAIFQLSICHAAKDFGVSRSTIQDHLWGLQSCQHSHDHQCWLSLAQEELLVQWVKVHGHHGVPLSPAALTEHATIICGKQVGSSWATRFLSHHPDLKVHYITSLEKCHANNVNPTTICKFFEMYKEVIDEFKIEEWNIYNMDEKGIQLGVGKKIVVIVDHDQKMAYNIENGDREIVTMIECISADGTALPPLAIFQGKHTNLVWGRNNPCNARVVLTIPSYLYLKIIPSISHSPNSWTNQELGLKWLEWDFEPITQQHMKSPDEYCLLILDSHNSHCFYFFCSFAEKHNIIIICLPFHTTHVLQPCDVGIFGPLATH